MTDLSTREIVEGIQYQGEDERVIYTMNTDAVGDGPTSPVLTVKDELNNYADVTGTVSTGSASAAANIITLPVIHSLTAGKMYRCEVKFDLGGNELEHWFRIRAEM